MKSLGVSAAFWLLLLPHGVHAQAPANGPEFEVATIRLNKTNDAGYANTRPGELVGRAITLKQFLTFAYHVEDQQIVGGPDWITWDKFDIIAKAASGAGDDLLRLMLQNFLAKEFRLSVHIENRPTDVYALVVGKRGSRLQKSTGTGNADCKRTLGNAEDTKLPLGSAELACTNMTMQDLGEAVRLYAPGYVDRPVVDLTELKGTYDFKLAWVSKLLLDQGGLTMFDAVDKQLGLKLEGRKLPMPIRVVDRAEKLSDEN